MTKKEFAKMYNVPVESVVETEVKIGTYYKKIEEH